MITIKMIICLLVIKLPLTWSLNQASCSLRYFSVTVSYWARISSKTLFRSCWGAASTSTFTFPVSWDLRAASSYKHMHYRDEVMDTLGLIILLSFAKVLRENLKRAGTKYGDFEELHLLQQRDSWHKTALGLIYDSVHFKQFPSWKCSKTDVTLLVSYIS